MKKQGFTLVELIGVIVILGLIAAFSVPALTKTMKESSEKQYENYVKNITLAAENYFHSETDATLNDKYFIKLKTLIDNGYWKKENNPKTNKETDENLTIMISKNEDGTEKYELLDMDATESGYIHDGLLVHYDGYNKPVDNVWDDLSGNGNNGTLYNFSDDSFGNNGIQFDGINDYIGIGEFNYPNITYEILFSNKLNDTTQKHLVSNAEAGGGGLLINSGTSLVGSYYLKDGYKNVFGPNLTDNKIYTAALTYDGNYLKLYLDGVCVATLENNDGIVFPLNNTILVISGNPGGETVSQQFFSGTVYSFRAYDRALNDDEINNNYKIDKYRFGV